MTSGNGNGNKAAVWRWIAGLLATIMLTGFASWLSFGGVTKEYIDKEHRPILDTQARLERSDREQNAEIRKLREETLTVLGVIQRDIAVLKATTGDE